MALRWGCLTNLFLPRRPDMTGSTFSQPSAASTSANPFAARPIAAAGSAPIFGSLDRHQRGRLAHSLFGELAVEECAFDPHPFLSADRTGASLIEARVQFMNSIYARSEDGFRVGLKFLDVPAATRDLISAFLAG